MINYSEMSDEEIKAYCKNSIEESKKREEAWRKKKRRSDIHYGYNPFDIAHSETPIAKR